MSRMVMPFGLDEKTEAGKAAAAEMLKSAPDDFKAVIGENIHLEEYLLRLPLDKIGFPKYYPKLSRKLGDEELPI